MMPLRVTLVGFALLASCQPAGELEIDVAGPAKVTFKLAGDSASACFENLRINAKGTTADTPAIWEIEKVYAGPSEQSTAGIVMTAPDPYCVKDVQFPIVPKGFELISAEPVTALPTGKYWVTGSAYQYYLGGDFSIEMR